jgi:hypothetical protein
MEVTIPEFQAERHDDVEQRLDDDADADECQYFLVIDEIGFDERPDRGQRAGGFLGGKDDEILVIFFVLEFVVVLVGIVGGG